jgi:putative phosphoribosyl transferase
MARKMKMFRDRRAAGERLAAMLEQYRGSDALVLAIPAGGVPVAAAIARALGLAVEVAPVSKVLFPWTTESGYGAVAFDGSVWIDDSAAAHWELTPEQIEKGIAEARAKVERRNARLRYGRPVHDLAGRSVILVDDGIAAGSTMRAAIAALRKLGAADVVVAVPTASRNAAQVICGLADAIHCPDIRGGPSFAVADAYEEWRDLPDEEIEAILKRWSK